MIDPQCSMSSKSDIFPSLDVLTLELEAAVKTRRTPNFKVSVLRRIAHVYSSSHPSEVVICKINGDIIKLLCKYSASKSHESHGHRGGIEYEAAVYLKLLNELKVSLPKCLGTFGSPATDTFCLMLEYLEGSARILKNQNPRLAIKEAATWLGRFHALCADRITDPTLSFLTRYDEEYYRGWIGRTQVWVRQAEQKGTWLEVVCKRFEEVLENLRAIPVTVIHGEFYPKNILVSNSKVYPVDWESTAIAPGEVDLVTLAEGWTDNDIKELQKAYQQARWPKGAPYDIHQAFCAARIYIQFRWLGDQNYPDHAKQAYLSALQRYAHEMEMI